MIFMNHRVNRDLNVAFLHRLTFVSKGRARISTRAFRCHRCVVRLSNWVVVLRMTKFCRSSGCCCLYNIYGALVLLGLILIWNFVFISLYRHNYGICVVLRSFSTRYAAKKNHNIKNTIATLNAP